MVSERPMSLNPLIDASDPAVVDVGHLLYRSLLKLDAHRVSRVPISPRRTR